jgi:hypothetical protein
MPVDAVGDDARDRERKPQFELVYNAEADAAHPRNEHLHQCTRYKQGEIYLQQEPNALPDMFSNVHAISFFWGSFFGPAKRDATRGDLLIFRWGKMKRNDAGKVCK